MTKSRQGGSQLSLGEGHHLRPSQKGFPVGPWRSHAGCRADTHGGPEGASDRTRVPPAVLGLSPPPIASQPFGFLAPPCTQPHTGTLPGAPRPGWGWEAPSGAERTR